MKLLVDTYIAIWAILDSDKLPEALAAYGEPCVIIVQKAQSRIDARRFVVVPADEAASAFYGQYGFKPIPGTSMMYIPLAR